MAKRSVVTASLIALVLAGAALAAQMYRIAQKAPGESVVSTSGTGQSNVSTGNPSTVALPPAEPLAEKQAIPSIPSSADPSPGYFTLAEINYSDVKKDAYLKKFLSSTYSFVLSLEEKNSRHSAKVSGTDPKNWWLGDVNKLPTAAWRVLANARIIADFPDLAESAKSAMERDISEFTSSAFGEKELWSLHQLYEGYTLTKDIRLFNLFWERVPVVEQYVKGRLNSQAGMRREHPSLIATLARELAQAAKALNDPEIVKYLIRYQMLPSNSDGENAASSMKMRLIKTAEELLQVMPQTETEKNSPPLFRNKSSKFSQYACWDIWVRSKLFLATNDDKYLDAVKKFFNSFDLDSDKPSNLSLVSLQTILPCADVLQELGSTHIKKSDSLLKSIFSKIILPLWDNPEAPLCIGDGGSLTGVNRPDQNICLQSSKSAADNSWLVYIVNRKLSEVYVSF